VNRRTSALGTRQADEQRIAAIGKGRHQKAHAAPQARRVAQYCASTDDPSCRSDQVIMGIQANILLDVQAERGRRAHRRARHQSEPESSGEGDESRAKEDQRACRRGVSRAETGTLRIFGRWRQRFQQDEA